MKKAIVLISTLFIFSCSSSNKKSSDSAMESKAMAPATTEAASKTAMTDKKEEKKSTAMTSAEKVTCKSGTDTRELNVTKTDSDGCELHYTKFGKEDVVATSKKGSQHCEDVLNRIKGKLAEAKFTCE